MWGGDLEKIYLSKSRTFLSFCFCFILAVMIFSLSYFDSRWSFYLYFLFFVDVFFLMFFWRQLSARFVLFCFLFFILGGLRFYFSIPENNYNNLNYYNGHRLIFFGKIAQEVIEKESGTEVVVATQTTGNKQISGQVLIFLPSYSDLKFGDRVQVDCKLEKPVGKDTFVNYDKYLARQGIWSVCSWAKIKKIPYELSKTEKIIVNFFNFKQHIQNQVDALWTEPESALMAGLLYGARANFNKDISNDFSFAGITHIIAISGYNISVIANVLLSLLLGIGLNRRHAFWIAIFGIILFVLFTGASASVVRAGVMGVVVLLATQLGRLSRIGNVLVFTAALMLLFNPFVLVWDAGFQLSFLSTLGLIYISPMLIGYSSQWHWFKLPDILKENLISTMSAIFATLPLILFQFGRLSLVAPLANMAILWIIPYLMLLGFIAIILSYIFFPLALAVGWVTYLGLKYVIIMAHWFAHWPLASVSFTLPVWGLVVIYFLMIIFLANRRVSSI